MTKIWFVYPLPSSVSNRLTPLISIAAPHSPRRLVDRSILPALDLTDPATCACPHAIQHSGASHPACLYPPLAAIDLFIVAQHDRLIEGMWTPEPHKQVGTIVIQAGLIFLGAEHVVGPLRLNLPGHVYLTPHGINGDHGSSE